MPVTQQHEPCRRARRDPRCARAAHDQRRAAKHEHGDFVSGERVILNEINTMPGFTSASMFPLVWKASGRTYSEVVTSLIDTAVHEGVGLR
ncbi:MAG: hypothetical protein V9E82_04155 [Candidatus Nanopelagicales bacterium]